jgi:hypothetical protein
MITYKQYFQEAATFPSLTRKTIDWGLSFLRKHFRHKISMTEAIKLIKQAFDFIENLEFKIVDNKEIDKNDIAIGGYHERNLTTIQLNINPRSDYFDFKYFDRLQDELKTVILHELVHNTQLLKRRLKPGSQRIVTRAMKKSVGGNYGSALGPSAKYFGDPEEIGAYAHTLALDLLTQTNNNVEEAIDVLKHHHYPTPSNYLNNYLVTFEPQSPVLKKLMKLTYQYLINAEKL